MSAKLFIASSLLSSAQAVSMLAMLWCGSCVLVCGWKATRRFEDKKRQLGLYYVYVIPVLVLAIVGLNFAQHRAGISILIALSALLGVFIVPWFIECPPPK